MRKRRNSSGDDQAKAAVRKHFRDLMDEDEEVKAARTFASYDLWHGPMTADQAEAEGYPADWDFETATEILTDWWGSNGGEVWFDSQSGYVETREPQGYDDDGEWIEPIWEDYVHVEGQDAKRAVFGELAEYL